VKFESACEKRLRKTQRHTPHFDHGSAVTSRGAHSLGKAPTALIIVDENRRLSLIDLLRRSELVGLKMDEVQIRKGTGQ
jgi:hypothetical protein